MKKEAEIEIIVNGDARSVPEGSTVLTVLEVLGHASRPVAVELNRQIVSKALWSQTRLSSGDQLEIVHFVGGGKE